MAVEKSILNRLRKYATAFREARDRGATESVTVMFPRPIPSRDRS
jgi:hypothetical protein